MALMFDKADIAEVVPDPYHPEQPDYILVRLLRLIFYRLKISQKDLSNHYTELGRKLNWSTAKTRGQCNQHTRDLLEKSDKLSINRFIWILFNVLNLDVQEIQVVTRNIDTGEITTYSSGKE